MRKKFLVVDADTPIVRAAAVCENRLKVVNKLTGESGAYNSKKEFFKSFPEAIEDEYDFLEEPSLIISPNPEFKPEYRGMKSVKDFIESITSLPWVEDYVFIIGGEGNFRHEVAKTWPYKGKRHGKPILTDFLKEYLEKKCPGKVFRAHGVEADDILGWYGYDSFLKFKDQPKECPTVIAHLDKDINMVPGWHYNYDKGNIYWVSDEEGMKFFFKQMLYGDKAVDNIPGLNSIHDSIVEKFSIRKGKGIGEKGADKIIESCDTVQDTFEAVLFCYRACYPDNWLEYMQEQSDLLWMQRWPGSRFEIDKAITYYGINIDE